VESDSLDARNTIVQIHTTSDGNGATLVNTQRNLESVYDPLIDIVVAVRRQIHSLTNAQLQINHFQTLSSKM
jgi:hypothetical protein